MATSNHIEIPVTLHISQVAGAKLAERAAAAGKEMPDYVSALVESIVETPQTLAKISGPIHDRFLASGVSDDELSNELEQAKHDMRAAPPPKRLIIVTPPRVVYDCNVTSKH